MSIKGVHIGFITLSILLCLMMGLEGTRMYMSGGRLDGLALTMIGYASGLGLVMYGFRIIEKLKKL
jgi:hypothetical protein